jgi:hypothetical protein
MRVWEKIVSEAAITSGVRGRKENEQNEQVESSVKHENSQWVGGVMYALR